MHSRTGSVSTTPTGAPRKRRSRTAQTADLRGRLGGGRWLLVAGGVVLVAVGIGFWVHPVKHVKPAGAVIATATPQQQTAAPTTDPPLRATSVIPAFSRTRSEADQLSPAAAEALGDLFSLPAPSTELELGVPDSTASRRVWAGAGAEMFLVPTSANLVCYLIVPDNQSGCVDGARLATDSIDYGLYDPDQLGTGAPTVIHGLVTSAVVEVAVIAGGTVAPVEVQDGTFYTRVGAVPTALRTTSRDGTTTAIELPQAPTG